MSLPKPIVCYRQPLWLRLVKWFFTTLGVVVFALFWLIVLIEWAVGCGETYVDAQGERHAYQCVFVPQSQPQQPVEKS